MTRISISCFLASALMLSSSAASLLQPAHSFAGVSARMYAPAGNFDDNTAHWVENGNEKNKGINKKPSTSRKARGDAPCLCWVRGIAAPRAVILCIHGLGLHGSSFEQFGKAMSQLGYAVYAIDVRGFGSWMEAKGHQNVDFQACLDDVKSTLEVVRRANPGVPVFLLGESMGGAIALQATAAWPDLVDGLISAVPAAERFQQKKTDLKVALHLLTFRKVNVEKDVVNKATKNPELREEWKDDPLSKMNLKPKELIQFQAFMNRNHEKAKDIVKTPVLMVQGGKDKLVKAEGTKELFEEIPSQDKIMATVNGAEHLVYEEGQFTNEVLKLTDQWIRAHLPKGRLAPDAELIEQAKAAMSQQQLNQAIGLLEQAVQQNPANAEANFMLGFCYAKSQQFMKAKEYLRRAVRLARMSPNPDAARKANEMLLTLPQEVVKPLLSGAAMGGSPLLSAGTNHTAFGQAAQFGRAGMPIGNRPRGGAAIGMGGPRFGPRARMQRKMAMRAGQGAAGAFERGGAVATASGADATATANGADNASADALPQAGAANGGLAAGAEAQGVAKVYIFSAKWCEPCKDLEPIINEAKRRFGTRIEFVTVDVDDPSNEPLVEKYNVSPIPTIVFVRPNGQVADYSVGYAGVAGMIRGMSKLLTPS
ncbi:MAG TPA: alpha/beta fold hydrolase [Candidatus Obscuribacterales bacterium]